jgi:hypothetical protein
MMFTIEFFRIRESAPRSIALPTSPVIWRSAKVKANSLFDTLNLPQNDGLGILDQDGHELFFWTPATDDC